MATNAEPQAKNTRPLCDFPDSVVFVHSVSFVYRGIQTQRALAAPELLRPTQPMKHSLRKGWIPGPSTSLGCEKAMFWSLNKLPPIICSMCYVYAHTNPA